MTGCKTPNEGPPWQLYKYPKIKPGDTIISSSSGRVLQNNEGTLTEVPNGLKRPYTVTPEDIAQILIEYKMMERKNEVDPESHEYITDGTHLNTLHGPSAATEFRKKCDLSSTFPGIKPVVTERIHNEGFTVVETIWHTDAGERVAGLRLHLNEQQSHYDKLTVEPNYQGKGFYQSLIKNEFASWWKSKGVVIMTASPESQNSRHILEMGGFHWQKWYEYDVFAIRLDIPDRRDEYLQWIKNDSPKDSEPQWHQELRLRPKLL